MKTHTNGTSLLSKSDVYFLLKFLNKLKKGGQNKIQVEINQIENVDINFNDIPKQNHLEGLDDGDSFWSDLEQQQPKYKKQLIGRRSNHSFEENKLLTFLMKYTSDDLFSNRERLYVINSSPDGDEFRDVVGYSLDSLIFILTDNLNLFQYLPAINLFIKSEDSDSMEQIFGKGFKN